MKSAGWAFAFKTYFHLVWRVIPWYRLLQSLRLTLHLPSLCWVTNQYSTTGQLIGKNQESVPNARPRKGSQTRAKVSESFYFSLRCPGHLVAMLVSWQASKWSILFRAEAPEKPWH